MNFTSRVRPGFRSSLRATFTFRLESKLSNVFEATTRKADVLFVLLGACNNARLSVRREPHSLGLVENSGF